MLFEHWTEVAVDAYTALKRLFGAELDDRQTTKHLDRFSVEEMCHRTECKRTLCTIDRHE